MTDQTQTPEASPPPLLDQSAALRVPLLQGEATLAARAEELADHILRSADMRGQLAEARLRAHRSLLPLLDRWRTMQGWQVGRAVKNQADIERAKEDANPKLAADIRAAKWFIDRTSEEMDRHDKDFQSCSRAHKILTGQ